MNQQSIQIEMNFKQVTDASEKIQEVAGSLKYTAEEEIISAVSQLLKAYDSINNAELTAKGRELAEGVEATAEILQNTAEKLRLKAQRLYEAERNSQNLAINRIYQ